MINDTSDKVSDTIEDIEQKTSLSDDDERDQLMPLRELRGLDKQIRTIRGSLKVAVAKSVEYRNISKKKILN